MPAMVDLSVHLPATESPIVEVSAFRHAGNGISQHLLTGYRKSDGGGLAFRHANTVGLSVHLPSTESPMAEG